VQPPTEALLRLQLGLVLAAAATLGPGGRLLYSVCTLTAQETTGVARAAIDALGARFRVVGRPGWPWRPAGDGALLLPQDAGTDGMFVLVLERARE
jgi:16S rRNA (cytosine967-C5)-methyltransferase